MAQTLPKPAPAFSKTQKTLAWATRGRLFVRLQPVWRPRVLGHCPPSTWLSLSSLGAHITFPASPSHALLFHIVPGAPHCPVLTHPSGLPTNVTQRKPCLILHPKFKGPAVVSNHAMAFPSDLWSQCIITIPTKTLGQGLFLCSCYKYGAQHSARYILGTYQVFGDSILFLKLVFHVALLQIGLLFKRYFI